jgi:GT2 family glycosyltransferase
METHREVGIVGPKLLHPDRSMQESAHRFPTPFMPLYRRTPLGKLPHARREMHRYAMRGELGGDAPMEVDWMEGAALLVRKKAIEEVGMLDERFFMYMEDADWARRFWDAGWKVVWHPGATLMHYHRRASADTAWFLAPFTNKVTRFHIVSAVKYFRKWRGVPHPARKA